ncbi:uncharacterized protein DEA37_0003426 [Paragonimus westermani]|uniref:Uncharacterized protein n=1 Tax=Paragonimus westermani TaxID=34504 RepID=A0A5J4NJQ5_9TREM|nr:uncharacterized protein DEA37_0003426 [Paragonimus westermani]
MSSPSCRSITRRLKVRDYRVGRGDHSVIRRGNCGPPESFALSLRPCWITHGVRCARQDRVAKDLKKGCWCQFSSNKAVQLQQRAQMTEAKFYDQLVEVRRENELELAKAVTRKNAELAAAQQAAEAKHQELQKAVDRLEGQLAAAVSNAERIRLQSEEQTKELQSTMARQLEDLAQRSAERHEQLIVEHEKELQRLREVHEQECQNLTKQIKRTSEIQLDLDEKIRHCNQLESLNREMFEAKNKAVEKQELAEKEMTKQAEHIQRIQTELQTAMIRLKELKEQHAQTLKDHTETVTRLRTDCANQLAHSASEYADKISQLYSTIEHARSEKAYQLELDKARNSCADAELLLEQKKLEFTDTIEQLQKRIYLLETKYSAQSKTVDTQTAEPCQNEMLIERVSQGVATKIVRWQEQSVEKLLEKVMEEKHTQLKCALEEKEKQLVEQRMLESAQLNADHAARYGDLKRREELARHRLAEVEFELGEAKRKLTKECDMRRQQLTEISVAREKERQEWFRAQERKLNELEQCHQQTLQQLRKEHADEIQKITLKEKVACERSRARLAEAALKQREILWTELSAKLQEMQKQQQNTALMPAEVQDHLQATIEALRVQVRSVDLYGIPVIHPLTGHRPIHSCTLRDFGNEILDERTSPTRNSSPLLGFIMYSTKVTQANDTNKAVNLRGSVVKGQ